MRTTIVLAVLTILAVVANFVWKVDKDAGITGKQKLSDDANYNKAVIHAVFAFGLYSVCVIVGAPILGGVLVTTIGILGWEWSQEVWRKFDIYGGFGGLIFGLIVTAIGYYVRS